MKVATIPTSKRIWAISISGVIFFACIALAVPEGSHFPKLAVRWEADFDKFMTTPGRLGFHFSDLPEIRQFSSYNNLVSSTDERIEEKMIEWAGSYPYTPAELCMAIAICDRKGWDPFKSVKIYFPRGDRFRIPDAVRRMLKVERNGETKIDPSVYTRLLK